MTPQERTRRLQLLAATLTDAACAHRPREWTAWEVAHMHAQGDTAAAAAAAPAMRLCADCPLTGLGGSCAFLARHGRYTGLAAGLAWVNGEPRRWDRTYRGRKHQPPQQQAS